MITDGSVSVGDIADLLESRLLEAADDDSARSDVRLAAMLVRVVAEDYDRVVDVLMADRAQIESLFTDCLRVLSDDMPDSLVDDIQGRLRDMQLGFRVSDLTARGDRDVAVLGRLRRHLEGHPHSSEVARRLNDVWRFIDDYTERRRYQFAV